jgi:hypothetical protein
LTDDQRSALVDEILAALDARGAPAGSWLVDIARVRNALASADDLLVRMQSALLREAQPPSDLPLL